VFGSAGLPRFDTPKWVETCVHRYAEVRLRVACAYVRNGSKTDAAGLGGKQTFQTGMTADVDKSRPTSDDLARIVVRCVAYASGSEAILVAEGHQRRRL
jgi:hypothetical protein